MLLGLLIHGVILIDGCIEMNKEAKAGFEEIGDPDSEATQNLVEYFDNKIQELEDKKEAAQGDSDDDDE